MKSRSRGRATGSPRGHRGRDAGSSQPFSPGYSRVSASAAQSATSWSKQATRRRRCRTRPGSAQRQAAPPALDHGAALTVYIAMADRATAERCVGSLLRSAVTAGSRRVAGALAVSASSRVGTGPHSGPGRQDSSHRRRAGGDPRDFGLRTMDKPRSSSTAGCAGMPFRRVSSSHSSLGATVSTHRRQVQRLACDWPTSFGPPASDALSAG